MPRRSGGGGRMSAPRMPSRPAPAPSRPSNVPAPAPARPTSVAQPAPQQSSQPGLFGQMASTAAGVAVGSTVGHVLGGAITGAFSGGDSQAAQAQQQAAPVDYQSQGYQQPQQYQQEFRNPCEFEFKQFMDCAQNQYDISLCQGFNEALKQCKIANNIAM